MRTVYISDYTFDKAAQTITFNEFTTIDPTRLLRVTDIKAGIVVYMNTAGQQCGGSFSGNVLTLEYNTNTANFRNDDPLLVEYISENDEATIIASAAQTATFNSSAFTNHNHKGVTLIVNTTAFSGTLPTLVVKMQMKDPVSASWVDVPGMVTGEISGTGQTVITMYPGLTVSANSKIDYPLPRTCRLVCTIGGTTPSFTFSVGAIYHN